MSSAELSGGTWEGTISVYVTFEPRPTRGRPDLQFWGSTTIWVVIASAESEPRPVTQKNEDDVLDLEWLNNDVVLFDGIADEPFYQHAPSGRSLFFTKSREIPNRLGANSRLVGKSQSCSEYPQAHKRGWCYCFGWSEGADPNNCTASEGVGVAFG